MNVLRTSLGLLLPLLLVIASVAYAATLADQYDERHEHAATRGSNHFAPKPRYERQEATDHHRSNEKLDKANGNHNANMLIASTRTTTTMLTKGDDKQLAKSTNGHLDKLQVKEPLHDDESTGDDVDRNELGEMQVGCAQGLFDIKSPSAPNRNKPIQPADKRLKRRQMRKRAVEEFQRKRRNFQTTYTVWQPPVYQLSRPYIIPVWGSSGRLPIYFPPQPVLVNRPTSDPRKSYLPPKGYLPPDHKSTTTIGYDDGDEDATVPLRDRNLDPNDDAPIWDIEPPFQAPPPSRTTPPPNAGGIGTRRTRRPGVRTTTIPPLVHRSENNTSNQRPNSLRPQQDRPTIIQGPSSSASSRPPANSFGGFRPSASTPAPTQQQQPARSQPSRCVWAIISCCTGNTTNISYNCFEQLGCTGAFWDSSPCDSDFAKAAINVALQYYSKK